MRLDPRRRMRGLVRRASVALLAVMLVGAGMTVAQVAAQTDDDGATEPSSYVAIKGVRAFDSRVDFPVGKVDSLVQLPVNGGGETIVPAEATAVAFTITATATEGSGFAFVDTYDGTDNYEISTVAWTGPGQREVNSGVVKTFDGSIDGGTAGAQMIVIGVGGTNAAAHIIIDITGYLVETP